MVVEVVVEVVELRMQEVARDTKSHRLIKMLHKLYDDLFYLHRNIQAVKEHFFHRHFVVVVVEQLRVQEVARDDLIAMDSRMQPVHRHFMVVVVVVVVVVIMEDQFRLQEEVARDNKSIYEDSNRRF